MLVFTAIFAVVGLTEGGLIDYPKTSSPRIHGGVDAPPAFSPHMAALLHGETRVRVVCGGSIISRRHVLTAAHCVTPFLEHDKLSRSFQGRVGSNIWHSGGLLVQFLSHYIHPEWDEDTLKYDAAILLLSKKLVLNKKVTVIGLDFGWVGGNEPSFVTGWGTTWPSIGVDVVQLAPTPDALQLLYANTLTPQQCYEGMQARPQWAALAPQLEPTLEICTFHSVGYGMCHGDSGSALVSARSGLQSGIVSWGMPCAVGAPDVYTRVKALEHFIRSILNACPSSKPNVYFH